MIGTCISLMPWPLLFDMAGMTDLSQYFAALEQYEGSSAGRKFLRGLRELHYRMQVFTAARRDAIAAKEASSQTPADRDSSSESSDQESVDRQRDVEQGAGPSVSSSAAPVSTASMSTAPVGGVIRNEKSVCCCFSFLLVLISS